MPMAHFVSNRCHTRLRPENSRYLASIERRSQSDEREYVAGPASVMIRSRQSRSPCPSPRPGGRPDDPARPQATAAAHIASFLSSWRTAKTRVRADPARPGIDAGSSWPCVVAARTIARIPPASDAFASTNVSDVGHVCGLQVRPTLAEFAEPPSGSCDTVTRPGRGNLSPAYEPLGPPSRLCDAVFRSSRSRPPSPRGSRRRPDRGLLRPAVGRPASDPRNDDDLETACWNAPAGSPMRDDPPSRRRPRQCWSRPLSCPRRPRRGSGWSTGRGAATTGHGRPPGYLG